MRALKLIIALIISIVVSTSTLLVSAGISANIILVSNGIDPLTDKVTVSGYVNNGIVNSVLTMLVLKPNADEVNMKISDIVHQDQTRLNVDAIFDFEPFSMLVDAPSGDYKIIVTGQKTRYMDEVKAQFNYIGKSEVYEGLVAIEQADLSSMAGVIEQYGDFLLIDKTAYKDLSSSGELIVNNKLLNLKLSIDACSDYDSNPQSLELLNQKIIGFRAFFNEAITIGQFSDKDTALEVEEWLNTYTNKAEFGQADYSIDYDFDGQSDVSTEATIKKELDNRSFIYSIYEDDFTQIQKNKVLDALSNKNELKTVNEIREAFYEQILLKAIEFQTWTQTKSITQRLPEYFNIDYSDFNQLNDSNKDKVYQEVSGIAYSTLSGSNSFKQAFENVATEELKKQNAAKISLGSNTRTNSGGFIAFTPSEISGDNKKTDISQPIDISETSFNDISGVTWAVEAIANLSSKGIIDGKAEGVFAPNDAITRAEFIKILIGAFELVDDEANTDFKDVQENDWYYKYIASAQKRDIVAGRADGTFGVDKMISRQDMVVLLDRVAKLVGVILPQSEQKLNFMDFDLIDNYAKQAVREFANAGIVSGMDNDKFAPLETATRAQAAKLIFEILKLVK